MKEQLEQKSIERNSPSSPNLSADNHEGVGEGLDVTACSASPLCGGAIEPEDILNWIGSKLEPIGFVRKS